MGCEKVNCIVLVKNNRKYLGKDYNFTSADIQKFLEADAAGTLKPFLKSAEVPKERYDEDSLVLVGKNFEKEIKGKNVFVFL